MPKQFFLGKGCFVEKSGVQPYVNPGAPVDGVWGDWQTTFSNNKNTWTQSTKCSKTCKDGVQYRLRPCAKYPEISGPGNKPSNGGSPCRGSPIDLRPCAEFSAVSCSAVSTLSSLVIQRGGSEDVIIKTHTAPAPGVYPPLAADPEATGPDDAGIYLALTPTVGNTGFVIYLDCGEFKAKILQCLTLHLPFSLSRPQQQFPFNTIVNTLTFYRSYTGLRVRCVDVKHGPRC